METWRGLKSCYGRLLYSTEFPPDMKDFTPHALAYNNMAPINTDPFIFPTNCSKYEPFREVVHQTSLLSRIDPTSSLVDSVSPFGSASDLTADQISASSSSDISEKRMLNRRSWQEALSLTEHTRLLKFPHSQYSTVDYPSTLQHLLATNLPISTGIRTSEFIFEDVRTGAFELQEYDNQLKLQRDLQHARYGYVPETKGEICQTYDKLWESKLDWQHMNPVSQCYMAHAIAHPTDQTFGLMTSRDESLIEHMWPNVTDWQYSEGSVVTNAAGSSPVRCMSRVNSDMHGAKIQLEQLQNIGMQKTGSLNSMDGSLIKELSGFAADSPYCDKEPCLKGNVMCFSEDFCSSGQQVESRKRAVQDDGMQLLSSDAKRLNMGLQASGKSNAWTSLSPDKPASNKPASRPSASGRSSSASSKNPLGAALNTNLKPRARQGTASDPQSIAARHRRERINARLKALQELVPNGSKVDLVTMLEKAVNYVKFLQLQLKVLTNDDYWPSREKTSQISEIDEKNTNETFSESAPKSEEERGNAPTVSEEDNEIHVETWW